MLGSPVACGCVGSSMVGDGVVDTVVVGCGTGSLVVGGSVSTVVVMGWSLNLTSAMCTHSIRSPDGLLNSMKYTGYSLPFVGEWRLYW